MAAKLCKEPAMEGKTDLCVVCCSVCEIFAFGACDHSVCYECSTRMRVLCEQNECPICRQELAQVVFVRKVQKFADVRWNNWPVDDRYNIYFETATIQRAFEELLDHSCNLCGNVFRSLYHLKEHTRREHDRFFCELCVNSLKIFSYEYKCYTRAELAQHRRKGEENTSHRGHPLCEFCDERYVDRDELFRHLRRDHFFCHFCDADGIQEFFCDYSDLRQHFLENHYLCEEGNCRHEKFTSAFRTDIDIKAHKATVHNKNMTKAQVKQARMLEVEFPLPPRPQPTRGGPHDGPRFTSYSRRRHLEAEDIPDGATGGIRSELTIHPTSVPSINSSQDFPSLDGNSPKAQQLNFNPESFAQRIGRANNFTVREDNSAQFSEDFPSLGKTSRTPSLQGQWNVAQGKTIKPITGPVQPKMKKSVYMHLTNDEFPSLPEGRRVSHLPFTYTANKVQNASSANNKKDVPRKQVQLSTPQNALTSTASTFGSHRAAFCDDDFPQLTKGSNSTSNSLFNKNAKQKININNGERSVNIKAIGKKRDGNEKKSSSVYISVQDNHLSLQDVADSLLGDTSTKNSKTSNGKEKVKLADEPSLKTSSGQNGLNKAIARNGEHRNETWERNERNQQIKGEAQKDKYTNLSSVKTYTENIDDFPELPKRINNLPKNTASKETSNIPPPGFNSSSMNMSKPPPGFGTNMTNTRLGSYSTKRSGTFATSFLFHQYHKPENFEERNQALIKTIQNIVHGDQAHFLAFKTLAGQYRKGVLSASDYYGQCINLLGNEFYEIFPELLVLLPDIGKQKELLAVRNVNQRDVNDNTKGVQFLVCATCQQVLASSDFRKHMEVHDLDKTFPTLSSATSLAK